DDRKLHRTVRLLVRPRSFRSSLAGAEGRPQIMNYVRFTAAIALLLASAALVQAQSNEAPRELTLAQCLDLALKQNPAILRAQQEIRRTHGLIVEARAEALPHLTASGNYTQIDPDSIDRFTFRSPALGPSNTFSFT